MTIHIAAASGNHAVLLSDSQGSSNEAESHGWHKQFIGRNFVVGLAGADDLGLNIPHTELEDKLIAALYYADAAIESLTVDDSFAVAILDSGRSYLTGDRTLSLRYVPEPIIQFWNQVSACWKPMQVTIATMNSELESAYRRFSNIRSGMLTGIDLKELERSNLAILANRQKLVEQLVDLKKTYEELMLGDHPAQFT